MASLATMVTGPMFFLLWAASSTAAKTILIIQMDVSTIGLLMGLFLARMLTRRWFATFGEVIAEGSKPFNRPPVALKFGFGVALVVLIFATKILLLRS
jgi:hypothetical protein